MAEQRKTAGRRKADASTQAPVATLADVVAATKNDAFLYVPADVSAEWVTQGLAEVNPDMKDPAGNIATRATQAGIDSVSQPQDANSGKESSKVTQDQSAAASSGASFELETGIKPPEVKRGRTGGDTKYPFDAMQVGHSFHVAVNAERKTGAEIAKSLASTVSSATERYRIASADGKTETVTVTTWKRDADGKRIKDEAGKFVAESTTQETRPVMVDTRKFVVRPVGKEDPKGEGARVFRLA